jgi:trehalose 6-phosphate phosphatase
MTTIAQLPDALESIPALGDRRLAVFLDYDGVLTPIVDDPARALLDDAQRERVARLARAVPTAIVSGRDTADVRRLVGVPGLYYAGSHGFEITDAAGTVIDDRHGRPYLPALDAAEQALRADLAGIPGAAVDRKRFAVAVHYRGVPPERVGEVVAAVRTPPGLRRTGGKKVIELRPDVDWDKGRAVRALAGRLGLSGATLLYVGDDVTDEDAFRAIGEEGIGVVVRGEDDGRETAARYALSDTAAVGAFIERLIRLTERSAGGDRP